MKQLPGASYREQHGILTWVEIESVLPVCVCVCACAMHARTYICFCRYFGAFFSGDRRWRVTGNTGKGDAMRQRLQAGFEPVTLRLYDMHLSLLSHQDTPHASVFCLNVRMGVCRCTVCGRVGMICK